MADLPRRSDGTLDTDKLRDPHFAQWVSHDAPHRGGRLLMISTPIEVFDEIDRLQAGDAANPYRDAIIEIARILAPEGFEDLCARTFAEGDLPNLVHAVRSRVAEVGCSTGDDGGEDQPTSDVMIYENPGPGERSGTVGWGSSMACLDCGQRLPDCICPEGA